LWKPPYGENHMKCVIENLEVISQCLNSIQNNHETLFQEHGVVPDFCEAVYCGEVDALILQMRLLKLLHSVLKIVNTN
jgi:hypothetical protein